jgi:hypothetical protein
MRGFVEFVVAIPGFDREKADQDDKEHELLE